MGEFSKLQWLKRTNGYRFKPVELRVLLAIFNHSDERGRRAHPGLDRIAQEACVKVPTASAAVQALKGQGWIVETFRGSGRSGKCSEFALVPDAPNTSADAETWRRQVSSKTSANAEPLEVTQVKTSANAETCTSANAETIRSLSDPITTYGEPSGSTLEGDDRSKGKYSIEDEVRVLASIRRILDANLVPRNVVIKFREVAQIFTGEDYNNYEKQCHMLALLEDWEP
ncbi:helix-turn-helix domain-containing protein [Nocardia cyriacigeorgica]|uniref:helix-turn-helix domain-containing protein n=1 Tax=Nocardia cyriacigeorgica TaxID=135487 RepID=UPI0018931C12|nr:helix-turn-helix domain-containing protein [Nocardia cyriacigeorgica]MBF6412887.1 helix-turn-helix domain-containing protein [Nocardia cyriacigeorgica]